MNDPSVPLLSDWGVNRGRPKSQMSLFLFRLAQRTRRLGARNPAYIVTAVFYRLLVEWTLGIEIPPQTKVGPRLQIFHGLSIVVNPHATIGADVKLRHGVTIGNRTTNDDNPTVGDRVDIGAYAAILGDIYVGDGAKIGAHAVVLASVPAGASAVGNPAKVILPTAKR